MKSILIGLMSSLLLFGIMYFLFIPKFKDRSYKDGYSKGVDEGMVKGIVTGKTEQKMLDDSLCNLALQEVAASINKTSKPKNKPPKKKYNFNINYKMNGNEIGERAN